MHKKVFMNKRLLNLLLAQILVMAILVRVFYLFHQGFVAHLANFSDDALITFRYSLNIVNGNGFVYNIGEQVLGSTTPLYVMLMTLPAFFGFDLMWASFIVNVLFDCLSIILIFKMTRDIPLFQLLAPLLFLSHPQIISLCANGMEMTMFIFLSLLLVWLYFTNKFSLAGLTAGLLLLCRIDGVLLLFAIEIIRIMRDKRLFPPGQYIFSLMIVFLPWVIVSLSYFGSVLPQSVSAKLLVYGYRNDISRFKIWRLSDYDFILFAPGIFGLASLFRRWRNVSLSLDFYSISVISLWVVIQALFFTFSPTGVQIYSWYRMPQHLVASLLAGLGVVELVRIFKKWDGIKIRFEWIKLKSGLVIFFIPFLVTTLFVVYSILSVGFISQPRGTQMHLSVGRWLNDHTESEDTVLAGNIGYIGYFCLSCRILDVNGLVSPGVLPELENHNGKRNIIIERYKPNYLAFENRETKSIGDDFIESQGYALMESYYFPGTVQSPYSVFKQISETKQD